MSGSREIGVLVVAWRPNCVVIPVSYFVHVSTMFPQPGGAVREPHITLFNGSCVPGASPLLVSVTYMDFICVDGIPAAIALTRTSHQGYITDLPVARQSRDFYETFTPWQRSETQPSPDVTSPDFS